MPLEPMLASLAMNPSQDFCAAYITVALRAGSAGSSRRAGERGAGNLKAILWTIVLVFLIYVGFKVVPILYNDYQFEDSIQTIARFASVNRETPEQIRIKVLKEAQRNDVPVQAGDVKIVSESGNIRINADFSIVVDLQIYQWTLNFHPSASNNSLT